MEETTSICVPSRSRATQQQAAELRSFIRLPAFRPVAFLENTSNTARDHLANERTYLAWLRTSLGLTSVGIAITQLFRLPNPIDNENEALFPKVPDDIQVLTTKQIIDQLILQSKALEKIGRTTTVSKDYQSLGNAIGLSFISLGIIFLIIGTYRYFWVQKVLQDGQFPHSRRSIGLSSFLVFGLLTSTMACIISLHESSSSS